MPSIVIDLVSPPFLRIFLPIYGVLFLGICIFWRAYRVWRATGLNPIRWGSSESTQDVLGRSLRTLLGFAGLSILLFSFKPDWYFLCLPATTLDSPLLKFIGILLLLESLVWVVIAQAQMGKSWRIGVDRENSTALVSRGLFKLSRNPVYLGMLESAVGFFLVLPNAISFLTLVSGYSLMQIQIRLEEEHLKTLHGERFLEYCKQVRRWI